MEIVKKRYKESSNAYRRGSSVVRFIKMSAVKVNDQKFLKSLELISDRMIVFDNAYNYYHQVAL
jgi:hypothetical protein